VQAVVVFVKLALFSHRTVSYASSRARNTTTETDSAYLRSGRSTEVDEDAREEPALAAQLPHPPIALLLVQHLNNIPVSWEKKENK
jgi:hypothetical protein